MVDESQYDPTVDFGRLNLSAKFHEEQDNETIERVVDILSEKNVDSPFQVLDAGCGYGTVTVERFGDDSRFEVVGIDKSESVVKTAEEINNADNIEYSVLDVKSILDSDFGMFDIVFSSYLFHHLTSPEQSLNDLWNLVSEPGAMIVRTCDDGQHVHYPDELGMTKLVSETDSIPGSSNRTHGRKLYTHMSRLNPEPSCVEYEMRNYDTVGLDELERERFFEVFHANRLHYAEVQAESDSNEEGDDKYYAEMNDKMSQIRQKFKNNSDFLDVKSVPMGVAFK